MNMQPLTEAIKKHKRFIITSHTNLEGDSAGSQLAMYFLIKALGKEAFIVDETPLPRNLCFLPASNKVMELAKDKAGFDNIDAVIIIDAAQPSRIGKVYRRLPKNVPIINIDHHISNTKFGDVNWIEPKASSCGEMVYGLYKRLKVPIYYEAAMCMYVAIATDSGYFRYSNTTAKLHRITAELLRRGVKPAYVNEQLNYRWLVKDIKTLAKILATINTDDDGKIAWVCMDENIAKSLDRDSMLLESESIINFPRAISSALIAVMFRQTKKPNEVKVSFRSKCDIDVNILAGYFGGGGHKAASGCTVKGKLKEVEKIVIDSARAYLRQHGCYKWTSKSSQKIS